MSKQVCPTVPEVTAPDMPWRDRTSTGLRGLDRILGGGLPARRVYLVEGPPGAGKTTLGLQFLLAGAAQDQRVLYITLSESPEELEDVARSHGWSLENVTIHEQLATEDIDLDAQQTVFRPAEVELPEVMRSLLQVVDQVDPARVVIDSLSGLRLLSGGGLKFRRQILLLKQRFAQRNATVLLLDDHIAETGLHLQSVVHGVIKLTMSTPRIGAPERRLAVLKVRGLKYFGGYHDYEIKTGGIEVYPRLAADGTGSVEIPHTTLSTDVPSLDAILGGGVLSGTSILLVGPAGTGKSTVAMQFAAATAQRGERASIFLFDERIGTCLRQAEAVGCQLPELYQQSRVGIQSVNLAESPLGLFLHQICVEVEEHDSKLIVVDSVSGWLHGMPSIDQTMIQIHELLEYVKRRGVTLVMTLAQSGVLGTGPTAIDLSGIADAVLLFQYYEHEGRLLRAISAYKKRGGGHDQTIRELTISDHGVHIGERLSQFCGILYGMPQYGNALDPSD